MEEKDKKDVECFPKKPFRCLNCGVSFGDTDGIRLYCGEYAIFTLKVTVTCAKCMEHRTWRPVALMKNKNSWYSESVTTSVPYSEPTVSVLPVVQKP